MGFNVRILIARVLNNTKAETPRTHRITLLKFKGDEYLIDVGFGAMTPTIPLKISTKVKTINNYQISQNKHKDFILKIYKKESFFSLYKFNLDTYCEADCTIGNFYSESHPNAVFQNNLVVSKKTKDKILSFRNNSYHQISNTYTNILNIISPIQLQKMLKKDFEIKVSKKESKILFEKAEKFRIS